MQHRERAVGRAPKRSPVTAATASSSRWPAESGSGVGAASPFRRRASGAAVKPTIRARGLAASVISAVAAAPSRAASAEPISGVPEHPRQRPPRPRAPRRPVPERQTVGAWRSAKGCTRVRRSASRSPRRATAVASASGSGAGTPIRVMLPRSRASAVSPGEGSIARHIAGSVPAQIGNASQGSRCASISGTGPAAEAVIIAHSCAATRGGRLSASASARPTIQA